jgi:hypothetical protein
MVKVRAATLQKKRAVEMAITDAGEGADADSVQQGLYAEWQTSLYVADPVIDVSEHTLVRIPSSYSSHFREKSQRTISGI